MALVTSSVPLSKPRALVVDDSQLARHVLTRLLEQEGFDVDVADSAESAFGRLDRNMVDVVFMDHILPGIDGLDAVRHLRTLSRTRDLPIVMYTSQESTEFVDRASRAGADDVLVKTGPRSQVKEILRRLGLLPEREDVASLRHGADPTRGHGERAVQPVRESLGADPAAFIEALSPLIKDQHEKLRHGLLAEFAILERYEEGMRRDLFARVDTLMRASSARIDRLFEEHRRSQEPQRRRDTRLTLTIASTALIASIVAISIFWSLNQTVGKLIGQSQSAVLQLDAQNEALSAFGNDLAQLAAAAQTTGAPSPAERALDAADPPRSPAEPGSAATPNAAALLVEELQSMGILGPVRIETEVSSFCIRTRGNRLELEAGSLSFDNCEPVPIQHAIASRP